MNAITHYIWLDGDGISIEFEFDPKDYTVGDPTGYYNTSDGELDLLLDDYPEELQLMATYVYELQTEQDIRDAWNETL